MARKSQCCLQPRPSPAVHHDRRGAGIHVFIPLLDVLQVPAGANGTHGVHPFAAAVLAAPLRHATGDAAHRTHTAVCSMVVACPDSSSSSMVRPACSHRCPRLRHVTGRSIDRGFVTGIAAARVGCLPSAVVQYPRAAVVPHVLYDDARAPQRTADVDPTLRTAGGASITATDVATADCCRTVRSGHAVTRGSRPHRHKWALGRVRHDVAADAAQGAHEG